MELFLIVVHSFFFLLYITDTYPHSSFASIFVNLVSDMKLEFTSSYADTSSSQ